MENFFGEITPALLVAIVTGIVQWCKEQFDIEGPKAEALSIGLSYLFLVPYQIITVFRAAPDLATWDIAWIIFQSVVYPILGWFMASGIYYKAIKPAQDRARFDNFPR